MSQIETTTFVGEGVPLGSITCCKGLRAVENKIIERMSGNTFFGMVKSSPQFYLPAGTTKLIIQKSKGDSP